MGNKCNLELPYWSKRGEIRLTGVALQRYLQSSDHKDEDSDECMEIRRLHGCATDFGGNIFSRKLTKSHTIKADLGTCVELATASRFDD